MSADLAARLRTLAQDYHDGRLNLSAYRALRAPLLDSLVASVPPAADLEVTRPRAVVRPQAPPEPEKTEPGRRAPVGVITIAVGLVAIGGVMFWVLKGAGGPSEVPSGRSPIATADAGAAQALVAPFLDRGDWSDGRLASLNASLLELSDGERSLAAREPWYPRFVDELRTRLKEQQALAATPLTADNSALAALAVTVGLDLNSPDAAIRIATVDAPPAAGASDRPSPGAESSAHAPRERGGMRGDTARTVSRGGEDAVDGTAVPSRQEEAKTGASSVASQAAAGRREPGARAESASAASAAPNGTSLRTASAQPDASASGEADAARETACRVELIGTRRPLCHDLLPSGEGPLLALIPAGAFEMGSTAADVEQPVHRVTLRAPFAISVNEVSQAEFRVFCAQTRRDCPPQPWSGDDYPVVNVSWSDARAYAEWLASVTKHRYRLPSEAEWEYAARAGQSGFFPGGDALSPTDAHFSMGRTQTSAAPRSQKFKPNGFRLLHTVGNVREWVEDAWVQSYAGAPAEGSPVTQGDSTTRVVRGGSYADGPARLRLSMREGLPEGTRDSLTGFRVVRELQ